MKLVIDTNVLVSSLSSRSQFHKLIEYLLEGHFDLLITHEILLEYEEIIFKKYNRSVASNFIAALQELPNVYNIDVFYQWNLLKDADDNKFVDCAIAGSADFIVSHDSDFRILTDIEFPKVKVLDIHKILELLG